MLKSVLASIGLLAVCLGFVTSAGAAPGSGSSTSLRLEARMRAGAIEAKVAYTEVSRAGVVTRKVQAEISRALPNTTYLVAHQGVTFASITTNGLGAGKIELVSGGDNPNRAPVPVMRKNETASVGALSAPLIQR